jgi:hypothetical protein
VVVVVVVGVVVVVVGVVVVGVVVVGSVVTGAGGCCVTGACDRGAGYERCAGFCTTTVVTCWGACGAGGAGRGADAAGAGMVDVAVTAASTGVVVASLSNVKPNTAAAMVAATADNPNSTSGPRRGGSSSCHSSWRKCTSGRESVTSL